MTDKHCESVNECANGEVCAMLQQEVGKNTHLVGCSHFKPKEPMTNEGYIRQASTEELAKFFQKITDRCFACGVKNADGTSNEPCKERFCSRLVFEWLKEIHSEV